MKNKQTVDDSHFMSEALKEAKKAYDQDEVPVGAVIILDNKIISRGFNKCISVSDPTAHAEIVALRKASKKLKNYRLNNCFIYVTIEPCQMCAGALINARIKRIIFGAYALKSWDCKSTYKVKKNKKLNHQIGFMGEQSKYLSKECADIIKKFFREKRKINGDRG